MFRIHTPYVLNKMSPGTIYIVLKRKMRAQIFREVCVVGLKKKNLIGILKFSVARKFPPSPKVSFFNLQTFAIFIVLFGTEGCMPITPMCSERAARMSRRGTFLYFQSN